MFFSVFERATTYYPPPMAELGKSFDESKADVVPEVPSKITNRVLFWFNVIMYDRLGRGSASGRGGRGPVFFFRETRERHTRRANDRSLTHMCDRFGVHSMVCIAIFVLSSTNRAFSEFRLPMRVTSLVQVYPNGVGNTTGAYVDATTRTVGLFRIGPLTGVFSLLSALAHLVVVLPKVREVYERGIDNHINHFRWVEYFCRQGEEESTEKAERAHFVGHSSSVMIFLIAMFFGIYEIPYLMTIVILNAGCMWCGDLMEVMNPKGTRYLNWSPFLCGCLLEFGAFQAIYVCLFSSGVNAPSFVYAILATQTLGFSLFAVNMALQYGRVGPWRDYRFGELMYMVLSATFKVLLAWLVFGGLNQPNLYNKST